MSQPLGELQFQRLLVAVDGSEASDLALSAAITAARQSNASVTLVSVAPVLTPSMIAVPLTQDDLDEATAKTLSEAVERIPEDVPVHTINRRGRAGQEIVAVAASGDYDAIIIGARGVGRFHGLVGSVSQHVLHHAPVSVIVAHPARQG